jgi:high-affinity iron transporter
MRKSLFAAIASIFILSLNAQASGNSELVVHLLDYLAKDYGGAVQSGKVISESEYAEQVEFAGIVEKNSKEVEALKDKDFAAGIEKLKKIIATKGDANEVALLARKLQQDAIRLAKIEVAPTTLPDIAHGKELYQANCVTCHGATGHGDGIAGANLDPKPANFFDEALVLGSAPYKFYNTIRLGVPGTGMASFSHLTDHEVWALAFYLKSLPYADRAQSVPVAISMKESATLTDEEILEKLGGKSDATVAALGSLRAGTHSPEVQDPLTMAEALLSQSLEAAKANKMEEARSLAIRAYLEGIEPVEPKMKANLPGFVEQIESQMGEYRAALDAPAAISVIEQKEAAIRAKLAEAKQSFSERKMSPGVAFGAAFSIFLREGFEAVLIIIVLLSILRAMNQPEAVKWVHAGWAAAVVVGIAAWFASGVLLAMSGLSRELMEGAISILAVIVLLYVGFWLHRYSEMKKWHAYLQEKLKHGLSTGSYVGLTVVSFLAVFREAFEVVLFLRAIWIDLDPSGQTVASSGVLAAVVILISLSILAVKESKKIPLGLLFQVCSWTMIVLAIILAGKGVHSLQEAGLLQVSPLNIGARFDLIGLFPTTQTLLAQAVVILIFVAVFVMERRGAVRAKN